MQMTNDLLRNMMFFSSVKALLFGISLNSIDNVIFVNIPTGNAK